MKPDETPENLWLQVGGSDPFHVFLTRLADHFRINLQVDDLNRRFTFQSNQFDLVHSRFIASGLDKQRWPRYVHDIAR